MCAYGLDGMAYLRLESEDEREIMEAVLLEARDQIGDLQERLAVLIINQLGRAMKQ